jgi:HK97 family phage portal protein
MASLSFISTLQNALTVRAPANLQAPHDRGNWWWPLVREPYTGAWQRNAEQRKESILTFGAVYSCVTLIASDIAKMRIKLVEQDRPGGIWSEVEVPAFSPVLRKPNKWQNRISFVQQWLVSKLLHGNTYVLKQRDNRGVVVGLYILDPTRCKPLVGPEGEVYYELSKDNLSGIEGDHITVPASEIIHDIMVALFHPLVGVSPLFASSLSASHGLEIQKTSARLFRNNSQPGGILTAPAAVDKETAQRIKEHWEANFTGENFAKVAVLGDGLKYERMSLTYAEAQLVELLKWDETNVCTAFHVPAYKIGVGQMPTHDNIEALNLQYYEQCLQGLIESMELLLDEGLGLTEVRGKTYGVELDVEEGLLRMDMERKIKSAVEGLKGVFTPNEARRKFDLKPIRGGDTVYMQQQNYSLEALAKRDASEDPFGKTTPSAPSAATAPKEENDVENRAFAQMVAWDVKPKLRAALSNLLAA